MKRVLTLLLFLVCPLIASARVLSYGAYSEALAARGQQSRTTRHVVVIEGLPGSAAPDVFRNARVVVYDTLGLEEPVVGRIASTVSTAALHQPDPGKLPLILVAGERTFLSRDAGHTWLTVDVSIPRTPGAEDRGGPYTRGLGGPVQIGTSESPFVVSATNGVLVAISPEGNTRVVATGARLIGRNLDGSRFLIVRGTDVSIVDLQGRSTPVASELAPESGWITSSGAAYTLTRMTTGALRLRFHEHQQESFKTGRTGFFAVPTADFDGAWMVQQGPGEPTTLSRHLPDKGEEEMWTDPSGPLIDALHAGHSGQTLLIQAPRRRQVTNTPFRGVALAPWRVGQPAPREYDELYARMGVNRGFAHVDPDTVASGSPFVFDTALTGWERDQMRAFDRPAGAGGGADVMQEWGIVRGSLEQRLVLPTVSRIAGGYGTNWLTDVTIYNPLDTKQDVAIRFGGATTSLTLEPREIRVVLDVLGTLFGIDRGGGPLFLEPQKAMTVTSRTYTRSGDGALGFGMDAIDAHNVSTSRLPYSFTGALEPGNFRTNVLLTDLSEAGTQVTLHGPQSTVPLYVDPGTTLQFGRIDSLLGRRGALRAEPLFGKLMATVVSIDNATNDATYFPPDLAMNEWIGRAFAAAAHIEYPDGWKLQTDVHVFNPGSLPQEFYYEAKPLDTDQWPRGRRFRILPAETVVIRDVLASEFQLHGRARLRFGGGSEDGVRREQPVVRATSRTYLVDPAGGTRGTLMPPLNNFQLATQGEALEIVGQLGTGLRMSLGLVDLAVYPEGDPSVVRISIYDDRGKLLDRFDEVLRAARGLHIDDLFASRGLTQTAAARIRVEVVTSSSLIGAYGMLTDVATRDTSYLSANRGGM